ncbi:hypothetical protein ACFFLM_21435 [Deinococcus oregonensis]|uniref:Uncharacterized protein n=1 Tax=Deinococcus oregonensis TaxID=1805970 RepID=A0ABV6B435_9DEIO
MSDPLLDALRQASTWPKALHRVASAGGEHFFAGFHHLLPGGMPFEPQIHLSLGPSGHVIWQRGNGPMLVMYMLNWGILAGWQLQFQVEQEFDENGDWPVYTVQVKGVGECRARDPLTATLQSLAQAHTRQYSQ